MRTGTRLRTSPALLLVALMLAMAGCSTAPGSTISGSNVPGSTAPGSTGSGSTGPGSATGGGAVKAGSGRPDVRATAVTPTAPAAVAAGESDSASGAEALPAGLTEKDLQAGVLSAKVKWKGSGELRTVRGTTRAPGRKGSVLKVRVQVERGLETDPERFADFVLKTLNDRRSWTENGTRRFARTDRRADAFTTVTLASPQTSAELCRPLRTMGKLSCRNGDRVVLTNYRWVKTIPEYKTDREGYRHYVVNHEVGHALGHGHEYCAGRGKVAPLMMQQTKGLLGCRPNPWPHP